MKHAWLLVSLLPIGLPAAADMPRYRLTVPASMRGGQIVGNAAVRPDNQSGPWAA